MRTFIKKILQNPANLAGKWLRIVGGRASGIVFREAARTTPRKRKSLDARSIS